MKSSSLFIFIIFFNSCLVGGSQGEHRARLVPAEEFSKSMKEGRGENFSIFRTTDFHKEVNSEREVPKMENSEVSYDGDPRYLTQGFQLQKSVDVPGLKFADMETETRQFIPARERQPERPDRLNQAYFPPPGSSAPYLSGQMTGNPSLWPDEGEGASLFRDFRAFQAMDVITILVNESSEGKKKAETNAESEYTLLAGISKFFGLESKNWESNNAGLSADELISANTKSEFDGKGETKRSGTLKARLSAVIMEVLPNGLLRIEGSKIISVNDEEEVMVLSGLARTRDIDALNQIDSSRVANMRIDFYGRGLVGDQQTPGWLVHLFKKIWPF